MGCLQGWDGGRFKSVKSLYDNSPSCGVIFIFLSRRCDILLWESISQLSSRFFMAYTYDMDLLFTFYTGVYFFKHLN